MTSKKPPLLFYKKPRLGFRRTFSFRGKHFQIVIITFPLHACLSTKMYNTWSTWLCLKRVILCTHNRHLVIVSKYFRYYGVWIFRHFGLVYQISLLKSVTWNWTQCLTVCLFVYVSVRLLANPSDTFWQIWFIFGGMMHFTLFSYLRSKVEVPMKVNVTTYVNIIRTNTLKFNFWYKCVY